MIHASNKRSSKLLICAGAQAAAQGATRSALLAKLLLVAAAAGFVVRLLRSGRRNPAGSRKWPSKVAARLQQGTGRPPNGCQVLGVEPPVRKGVYEAAAKAIGRQSVFALIMGDRLSPPKVTGLDLTGFAGAVGNEITVKAVDDFEVVSLDVTLRDAAGEPFEDGPATKGDIRWTYWCSRWHPLDR